MNKHKTLKVGAVVALLVSMMLLVNAAYVVNIAPRTVQSNVDATPCVDDPKEAWGEASYIIWKYNSTYYAARNMSTNMVQFLGTSKVTIEQNAINVLTSGGTIFLKEITLDSSVTYGSNILIIQDYQGVRRYYGSYEGAKSEATFIIDKSGSTYRAWYGVNSTLAWSSTNASYVFNTVSEDASAIKGFVYVKSGAYSFENCTFLHSNMVWNLDKYAVLQLAPNRPNGSASDFTNWCIFYGDSVENITIDGGVFDGNWDGLHNWLNLGFDIITHGTAPICVDGGRFITVKNAEVKNHPELGINFYNSYCCTVDSCFVHDVGWNGINFAGDSKDCTASNNVLWGNIGDIALECGQGAGAVQTFNCFIGNRVLNMTGVLGSSGAVQYAIRIEGGGSCIIRNNLLTGKIGVSDHPSSSGNNTITDNTIRVQYNYGDECDGICLLQPNNLVQGNTIEPANDDDPITCVRFDGGTNRVIGNTFIISNWSSCAVTDYSANYYLLNDFSQCAGTSYWNGTAIFPHTGSVLDRNIGYVSENSGCGKNSTALTFTFYHGLATTPTGVWASFSITGAVYYSWSWTATSTQVTITLSKHSGTMPSSWTTYWYAIYKP